MRLILAMVAAMLSLVASPTAAATTEVFILGALHGLHEQEESFDYAKLGQVIEAIKPDVILLEVTPEELAGRLETKGRPEYPKVIWPMLAAGGPRSLRHGGGPASLWRTDQRREQDVRRFQARVSRRGCGLDRSGDVQFECASRSLEERGRYAGRGHRRVEPGAGSAHRRDGAGLRGRPKRWDGTMVDSARAAIAANRDKRILVLGSYRNRFMFVDALNGMKDVQVDRHEGLAECERVRATGARLAEPPIAELVRDAAFAPGLGGIAGLGPAAGIALPVGRAGRPAIRNRRRGAP